MAPQVSEANPKTDVLIVPGSNQSEDLGSGTKLNLILALNFFSSLIPKQTILVMEDFQKYVYVMVYQKAVKKLIDKFTPH